jgi:Sec7 domain
MLPAIDRRRSTRYHVDLRDIQEVVGNRDGCASPFRVIRPGTNQTPSQQQSRSSFIFPRHTSTLDSKQKPAPICEADNDSNASYSAQSICQDALSQHDEATYKHVAAAFESQALSEFFNSGDLLAHVCEKLRRGALFVKYGRHGAPHLRRVWVTPDIKYIRWASLDRPAKPSATIPITRVERVDEGITTAVFKSNRRRLVRDVKCLLQAESVSNYVSHMKLSQEQAESRCFSIVSSDRTLDLQTLDGSNEEWLQVFRYVQAVRCDQAFCRDRRHIDSLFRDYATSMTSATNLHAIAAVDSGHHKPTMISHDSKRDVTSKKRSDNDCSDDGMPAKQVRDTSPSVLNRMSPTAEFNRDLQCVTEVVRAFNSGSHRPALAQAWSWGFMDIVAPELNEVVFMGIDKRCEFDLDQDVVAAKSAAFLHAVSMKGLDREQLGEFFSKKRHAKVLEAYMNLTDFEHLNLTDALRFLFKGFKPAGEAQVIDRILTMFSTAYYSQMREHDTYFAMALAPPPTAHTASPNSDSVKVGKLKRVESGLPQKITDDFKQRKMLHTKQMENTQHTAAVGSQGKISCLSDDSPSICSRTLASNDSTNNAECESDIFGDIMDADAIMILSFSLLMLNTDLHNNEVRRKMSVDDFVRNNRGINGGKDLSRAYLEMLYHDIASSPIQLNKTEADLGTAFLFGFRGWINFDTGALKHLAPAAMKSKFKYKSKHRRYWAICANGSLFCFSDCHAAAPLFAIALQRVRLREHVSNPHCFLLSPIDAAPIHVVKFESSRGAQDCSTRATIPITVEHAFEVDRWCEAIKVVSQVATETAEA